MKVGSANLRKRNFEAPDARENEARPGGCSAGGCSCGRRDFLRKGLLAAGAAAVGSTFGLDLVALARGAKLTELDAGKNLPPHQHLPPNEPAVRLGVPGRK